MSKLSSAHDGLQVAEAQLARKTKPATISQLAQQLSAPPASKTTKTNKDVGEAMVSTSCSTSPPPKISAGKTRRQWAVEDF